MIDRVLNKVVPPVLVGLCLLGFIGVCYLAFDAGRMLAALQ